MSSNLLDFLFWKENMLLMLRSRAGPCIQHEITADDITTGIRLELYEKMYLPHFA